MFVGVCVGVGVTVFGALMWASFRMAGIEDARTERELREKAKKARMTKDGQENGQ